MDQVSFSIRSGESLAMIGETGSGKTMIALSILGLLPENVFQQGGRVCLMGQPLPEVRQRQKLLGDRIVYIPQNGLEALNPSRKIRFQIFDGLKRLGISRRLWEETAIGNLRAAGFSDPGRILELYPFQLSGGMGQRLTIALAAASQARLVIADEPTNGLDAQGRQHFFTLLDRVFPEAARLIITHDLSVATLCDRVLVLCGGLPMETGSQLILHPLHPYTKALLGALVENGMAETPILRRDQGLCPFYKRCPQALAVCRTQRVHHVDGQQEWWCNP